MTERPTPETDEAQFGTGRVSVDFARKLERERNEARALAKYWQEQYGHSNPEHEWETLPWEKKGGPR